MCASDTAANRPAQHLLEGRAIHPGTDPVRRQTVHRRSVVLAAIDRWKGLREGLAIRIEKPVGVAALHSWLGARYRDEVLDHGDDQVLREAREVALDWMDDAMPSPVVVNAQSALFVSPIHVFRKDSSHVRIRRE